LTIIYTSLYSPHTGMSHIKIRVICFGFHTNLTYPNLTYHEQKIMGQKEFRDILPYRILAVTALTP